MTHQLMLSAMKKWRKLDGQNRLPEIIQGVVERLINGFGFAEMAV